MGHFWTRARVGGLLTASFAIYGLLFTVHRRREKRDHRLIDVPANTWTGLKVFSGENASLELKREDGAFRFVHPYAGVPVEGQAIRNFLGVLERVPVRRRWKEKEDRTKYGIGPASPRIVLLGPKGEVTFALGNKNPVAPEFFVAPLDSDEITLIPAPSAALFQVRGMDFRNRKLMASDSVLSGWTWRTPGRPPIQGEKRGAEWTIAEGDGPFVPGDRRQADALEDRIRSLRLSDFEALDRNLSLKEAGVSSPLAQLTLRFSSGPAVEWAFGAMAGKDVHTVAVDGVIRGGVPTSFLAGGPQRGADLQRKNVVDFPLSAITRFTSVQDSVTALYEKQRGHWVRLGRERRPVDLRVVQTFLAALAKIKIASFDVSGTVEPVARQYTFYDGDGTTLLDLRLGTESAGQVPAAVGGTASRFSIPANDVEPLNL